MTLELITDDAARAAARRVLDRPEFASWQSRTGFLDLLKWLGRLHVESPLLFWTLTAGLTLLLLLVAAHVTWTVRKGLGARPPGGPAGPLPSGRRFVEEADALAERGRFLDAARTIQLGAIQLLVQGGRLRLGRGDANRVLRRQLGEARLGGEIRDELLTAIAGLERSWFRDRHEDEGLYRRWRNVYRTLAAEITAA